MTKIAPLSALSAVTAAALLLAACGSADDASTEASADTVEMPADQALVVEVMAGKGYHSREMLKAS